MIQADISYFDTLQGSAGMTRIELEELPIWLVGKPGVLIQRIRPLYRLSDPREDEYMKIERAMR